MSKKSKSFRMSEDDRVNGIAAGSFVLGVMFLILIPALALKCHQDSKSENDYREQGVVPVFYDNFGNPCREVGPVKSNWIIKGTFKYYNGDLYALYVVPLKDMQKEYRSWLNEHKDAIASEIGYVKLKDVTDYGCEHAVSRIIGQKVFIHNL